MNQRFNLRNSILALSLLTVSGFASADNAPAGTPAPVIQAQHRHIDPVMRAQQSLDRLAVKLNLKSEQQSAWQAYYDGAISRAKDRAAKMEEHRAHRGEARVETDTATRLDNLSQKMRDRADRLQKVAQDTRSFEGVLSPDQKTIFDLYWKAQWHRRMGHRSLA